MQTFRCDGCGTRLFFENVACLKCGREVGFDSAVLAMHSLDDVVPDLASQPRFRR